MGNAKVAIAPGHNRQLRGHTHHVGMGDEGRGPGGYFKGQARTYAIWCNQKLTTAGDCFVVSTDPDEMIKQFMDGTLVARMLQVLSGEQLSGIKWKPRGLKVFWQENMRICWNFMRDHEKFNLGGVNYISIMGGKSFKTVLALIWRWIQNYDIPQGVGDLLRWVQEHTSHVEATNFTTSFSDEMAFVDLYSNLFQEVETVSVEEWQAKSPAERMETMFDWYETKPDPPLGVPKMLEVQDLQTTNIDSSQVQTYVAAIRTAYEEWLPKWKELQDNRNDESQNSLNRGDELFKYGMTAFSNQKSKTPDLISTIVTETYEELSSGENPDYAAYTQKANDRYKDEATGFDDAIEKFGAAKDEYSKVTHENVDNKKKKCDDKIVEVNEYRDEQRIEIEKQLEEIYEKDRADRKFNEASDHLDTTIEEGGLLMTTIIEDITNKIREADRQEKRDQYEKEAYDRVDEWVSIFDPVREEFVTVEEMYPDNCVDEKRECANKRDEIDRNISEFKEIMRIKVAEAMAEEHDDVLYEDELLQMYHDTSVHCDRLSKGANHDEDPGLANLIKDPTTTKERLDRILDQVKGVWGGGETLRQKVHDEVDAIFNANGFDCRGTDCCEPCKSQA